MRASEVQTGRCSTVKVSGKPAVVRITVTFGWMAGATDRDGWTAVNVATGRALRIKLAPRFRAEVPVQP
jgi:hypothetical protein